MLRSFALASALLLSFVLVVPSQEVAFAYNAIGNITSHNGDTYTYHPTKPHAVTNVTGTMNHAEPALSAAEGTPTATPPPLAGAAPSRGMWKIG